MPEWGKYFEGVGVTGTLVLYDLQKDQYKLHNPKRAKTGFIPASTFKIFNSLVGLESGAVKDAEDVFPWDSVQRSREVLNQDHNMRSAFKHSVVWFYQEIANRVGAEKMKQFLSSAKFGNGDISRGLDMFWLEGGFRITPIAQVEFLKELYKEEVPFSERSIGIVKDIMIEEETSDYVLRAKTGWALKPIEIGWWIGWVERDDNVYFFALNIEISSNEDGKQRKEIVKKILREEGIL
ncbi:UNVERIFIED_CONTAM: hypothetical protein GTU68_003013 [Idotea baltica]|nr:hypothetical protein [Idotea baltica]